MAIPERDPLHTARSLYLAKSVLESSVVLQAVHGHIRSPSTLDVVFGKETALELVVLREDGVVQSICEQSVFGTIMDLQVLPWNQQYRDTEHKASGKDLLVLLSDSRKLSFLTFNMDLHRFEALSQRGLPQSNVPRRDLGRCLAIHPRGRAVAVGAFEDRLAIFPASQSAGNDIVEQMIIFPRESFSSLANMEPNISRERNIVVGWGTIWSMEFVCVEGEESPSDHSDLVLAVLLHRRGARELELQILLCSTLNRCAMVVSRFQPSGGIAPDLMAYSLVGIPAFPGLLIILRCGDLLVVDITSLTSVQVMCALNMVGGGSCESMQSASADVGNRVGDEETIRNVAASALLLLTRDMNHSSSHPATVWEDCPAPISDRLMEAQEQPLVTSWSWEPAESQLRLALGMDSGKIHIVKFSKDAASNLRVDDCGYQYKCAPCSNLLWTTGDFILSFVHMGDGRVLRVGNHNLVCESFIQDIAPILDFTLVDAHGEKQDQMFACSGVGPEGSVQIIRNAISVGKLLSTPPTHAGVTALWTMRLNRTDPNHSFLVISFVGETRVLSVGLSFVDITDDVGFEPFARTLSCGQLKNGWVAQICSKEVRACAPTSAAHSRGVSSAMPYVVNWRPPPNLFVSLGAVSEEKIILSLSHPGLVLMLGASIAANGLLQLVGVQQCFLEAEISSILIPQEEELLASSHSPPSMAGVVDGICGRSCWRDVEVGKICVVGTHKPSVELLSIVPGEGFRRLAFGTVALQNANGTTLGGCVPESVWLSCFEHPYILAGLRNGMILRYEWPDENVFSRAATEMGAERGMLTADAAIQATGGLNNRLNMAEAVELHLVAARRIGISPVLLIPLEASLRSDILALSDRPWLLQTARHSPRIAYTTISFEPSTCATPVSMPECPHGILLAADCSLHLVEMERGKRLNVQRLLSGKTPRRVAYHSSSSTLLVTRTELCSGFVQGSDICCVDPISGALHSSYNLDPGETAKSLVIWKVGVDELIVVGTSLKIGPVILPSGEPESCKGRLLILRLEPKLVKTRFPGGAASTDENVASDLRAVSEDRGHDGQGPSSNEGWDLCLSTQHVLPGIVLAMTPYMGQYLLASAGNAFCCLAYRQDSHRLRRLAVARTRFMITSISVHLLRIAIGDCRDGVLLYSFHEELGKFELLYCDPVQRLVSGCAMIDEENAVATDWHGNFCCLTSSHISGGLEYHNPERNLAVSSWYHIGEAITTICKGSFSYRNPGDGRLMLYAGGSSSGTKKKISSSRLGDCSVVACSVLGSVIIFTPLEREEYNLLKEVQSRLAIFPLTAPLLGNNHSQFRRKGCPAGAHDVLDGDMLWQFLELTSAQQQAVLALRPNVFPRFGRGEFISLSTANLSIDQVLRVLERVHQAVT